MSFGQASSIKTCQAWTYVSTEAADGVRLPCGQLGLPGTVPYSSSSNPNMRATLRRDGFPLAQARLDRANFGAGILLDGPSTAMRWRRSFSLQIDRNDLVVEDAGDSDGDLAR